MRDDENFSVTESDFKWPNFGEVDKNNQDVKKHILIN
jgi:hypothetical protein